MALNKKFFPKVSAAADTFTPSEHFNTVLYTGNGGTQRVGGYINRGAIFNGSSSKIDIDSLKNTLDSQNIITASFWFRSSSTSLSGLFSYRGSQSADVNFLVSFSQIATGDIALLSSTSSGFVVLGNYNGGYNDGEWHHVAANINYTTGAYSVYIDKILRITGTNASISKGTADKVLLASNYNSQYLNGVIDQVRIFDKTLSSSEVTTLYGETHASTTISTTDIFNDNSGVALYQLDGNANDTGGVSGKFGSAAHFNGSSSSIVTTLGNSQLPVSGSWSCSCWINSSSFSNSTNILGIEDGSSPYYGWSLYQNTNGVLYPMVNGNLQGSGTTLTANQWYNVILTYNGTVLKFYVNDSQIGSDITISISAPSSNFDIGNLGIYSVYNGKIDQVRIYDTALSSSDVTKLYNESSVPTTNLVAHYKLDGDARDEQQLYDGTASNVTYAYDGTATNVTYQEATNFSPDLVWIKQRNATQSHQLADSVRGANKHIFPDLTTQEVTYTGRISSFDTNGFTLGSESQVNGNGSTYAAWCFNAGTAAAAFNTDGSITSTVKANTDAGFSIVSYTGTGATATIGHGLSSAPELIIAKNRDEAQSWIVNADAIGKSKILTLNTSGGQLDRPNQYYYDWNSTTITAASDIHTNGLNDKIIAYCFHSVDGYQKIGSYTGTGASGNMIETGFEPAFLLIKQTNISGSNWNIIDNKRDTENPRDAVLWADTSDTESTASQSGVYDVNFLSNGFSLENTYQPFNASGGTYIYLAIAADPDETTPTVENSFDVVTYTGNGSSQDIDTDFKPDLVWIKGRTLASNHTITDTVRGALNVISSNRTDSENYGGSVTRGVKSFNDNGFTLQAYPDEGGDTNNSGYDYVAWCFKAGDHDENLPQINTEGTIDSVVSVNDAAGFSIVKFNGGNTSGATVGHGLSSAPELIIVKNTSDTASWPVLTQTGYTIGATTFTLSGSSNYLALNSTSGYISYTFDQQLGGTVNGGLASDEIIAYCFTSITGYQKIGTYSGSGSSDVSVTTGFRPRWVMIKRTDVASQSNPSGGGIAYSNWFIWDSTRDNTNPSTLYLMTNVSNAESSNLELDFDDNGFTVGGLTTGGYWAATNASGGTYIYLAIA